MTSEEASALALFVKDHDTRFLAKASGEGDDAVVEITSHTGDSHPPVRSIAEYQERYIAPAGSPTIQAAWDKWHPERS
jgi:hypothetical protein